MSTLRFTRRVAIGATFADIVALSAGGAAEAGIAYSPDDVLYVAYVPGGREFIADLGPRSQFTGGTGAFDIGRFSALDVKAALGDPLPATINAAVFGIDHTTSFDAYLASRGPSDTSLIGNAFGASNQIFGFGALLTLARPVAGNPNAGFYLASDNFSYQRSLNGAHLVRRRDDASDPEHGARLPAVAGWHLGIAPGHPVAGQLRGAVRHSLRRQLPDARRRAPGRCGAADGRPGRDVGLDLLQDDDRRPDPRRLRLDARQQQEHALAPRIRPLPWRPTRERPGASRAGDTIEVPVVMKACPE